MAYLSLIVGGALMLAIILLLLGLAKAAKDN